MTISIKPTPVQLLQSGHYQKIAEIDIFQPTQFFQQYSRNSTFLTTFLLLTIAGFGLMGALTGLAIVRGMALWQMLWNVCLFAAFLLLILLPFHELIHAVTYKYFGAANIRFLFSLKPPAIFTCAHLLVINLIEVIWLAALPCVVISLLLVASAFFVPAYRLFFGWALIVHAFCCLGDMILISYAQKNRHKPIYNFDDLTEGKSYFFERTFPTQ
ncbi:DUF3267 domain-containing protein [Rhodocytophaga aerolata]|uniref:DUF3267 domain-containing protein n=1 Tax=Rhodocytophaga aerolata TaxID=455078 RepID=A0ABT8RAD0_9BACT|nr:DUF3267 domain-containing protein [Rhodocytophaga aerolata]MDO1447717.1 DUF3267 domain-containing protein [Rhodocytophaga aerolata]